MECSAVISLRVSSLTGGPQMMEAYTLIRLYNIPKTHKN